MRCVAMKSLMPVAQGKALVSVAKETAAMTKQKAIQHAAHRVNLAVQQMAPLQYAVKMVQIAALRILLPRVVYLAIYVATTFKSLGAVHQAGDAAQSMANV